MLLLPKKRVRRYQIILVLVLGTSLSSMFLVLSFQPSIQDVGKTPGSALANESRYNIADPTTIFNVLEFVSSLIFLIGLLVLLEALFLWVPSFTDFTESKGNMVWLRRGIIFPERVLSILDVDTRIIIRRKRNSIRGLFLREFTMEIHLLKDKTNIKQISDFSGIMKIVDTSSHNILVKTVMLEHLPLQIIQIRSLLSLMKQSPGNIISSE